MKVGISIKIDVTKIDKNRLFQGKKGKYLDLTTFIDTDNPSQYGDHGFVAQTVSREEKAQGIQTPILGNTRVFWGPQESGGQQGGGYQPPQNQQPPPQGGYQPQGQQAPQQQYQQQGQPQYQQQQAPQGQYQQQAPPPPQGQQVPDEDIPF